MQQCLGEVGFANWKQAFEGLVAGQQAQGKFRFLSAFYDLWHEFEPDEPVPVRYEGEKAVEEKS